MVRKFSIILVVLLIHAAAPIKFSKQILSAGPPLKSRVSRSLLITTFLEPQNRFEV